MTEKEDLLKKALHELSEFARDPHRDALLRKFTCPESRQMSELLGVALGLRPGYSKREDCGGLLPAPPGLIHPG